jgi:hypothetical protein
MDMLEALSDETGLPKAALVRQYIRKAYAEQFPDGTGRKRKPKK